MSTTPQRYLTTAEAARYLGLSTATLEQLRVRGGGPVYCKPGPQGRRVIYDINDLDAWVAAGKRSMTRETNSPTTAPESTAA
jgi:excisionase family DNA binding protein